MFEKTLIADFKETLNFTSIAEVFTQRTVGCGASFSVLALPDYCHTAFRQVLHPSTRSLWRSQMVLK